MSSSTASISRSTGRPSVTIPALAMITLIAAGMIAPSRFVPAAFSVVSAVSAPEPNQPVQPPLQTCLAAAADSSAVYSTTTFPAGMREVTCVFRTPDDATYEKLTSVWIAVNVGEAAPPNFEIARSDLPLQGKHRGRFRYSQDGPMPVGSYRLDVLADGNPWQSLEFSVAEPDEQAKAQAAESRPAELFPLKQGWAWRYTLTQYAGANATISAGEGAAAGDSKKVTAKVVMRIAGEDAHKGTHIEIERDGTVVAEEWWKVSDAGVIATQRKVGGELTALDPPQVLLALPLESGKTWTYSPADSPSQSYAMWGPLSVRSAPEGKLGWVVCTKQSAPPQEITVERHFVAGFGMTREVIVTAINGEMVSRQEMTLTGASAPPGS